MSDYSALPDGEYFVDEGSKIPPRDTWSSIPVSQLITVKNELMNRLHQHSMNKVMSRTLNESIAHVDALILKSSNS